MAHAPAENGAYRSTGCMYRDSMQAMQPCWPGPGHPASRPLISLICPQNTRAHTHTHTSTHARAHTHTLLHAIARTPCPMHARTQTHTQARTHAHTHTNKQHMQVGYYPRLIEGSPRLIFRGERYAVERGGWALGRRGALAGWNGPVCGPRDIPCHIVSASTLQLQRHSYWCSLHGHLDSISSVLGRAGGPCTCRGCAPGDSGATGAPASLRLRCHSSSSLQWCCHHALFFLARFCLDPPFPRPSTAPLPCAPAVDRVFNGEDLLMNFVLANRTRAVKVCMSAGVGGVGIRMNASLLRSMKAAMHRRCKRLRMPPGTGTVQVTLAQHDA